MACSAGDWAGGLIRGQQDISGEAAAPGNSIFVNDMFFNTKELGDHAWLLGHEMGHTIQWELVMLMSEQA